ncbi:phytoene/squalene synthase family protein [Ciceribacter azotifigens]|uniref:phytoene/squalene synthase family protein n=1 Tax=Ciceribacter azotifigens TaxID=2069303 RepID=UPI003A8BEBCF
MPDNEAICLAGLRDTDRDRYLAALLSPADKRAGLVALYGFNAEIARIRDAVREQLPGEVRLQYWRDLVSGVEHGETAANPLGALLLETIRRHDLPVEALLRMLDARIFDLYDDPIESRGMFEGYAGDTASALIQLASLILAPDEAANCAERAGHAGVAQAVAGSILLLPRTNARGQLYIPLEILKAVGLDREGFLAGEDRARISAAVEAFAGLGREHLAKVRRAGALPAAVMPAYLPVALVGSVLDRAVAKPARVLAEEIRAPQWRRQLLLMWAMFRRQV